MKRGFTLLESVIVIGISALALIALSNLFFIFNSIYGYQQVFMATSGSASKTLNALEAAVFPAEHVLASRSFSGTTYTSSTTVLVLELPSIDSSGNIISGVKDYVAFYTDSAKFYRLVEAGSGSTRVSGLTLLSTTLNALSFTYDNADFAQVANVTAELRMQAQFKQEVVQSHLREQLHLRNLQPTL